jgi:transposase
MAKAGVRGRPVAPLILTAQERAYLERQVRRHRVARSLSERCRVILRCADGVASKDVAAELGLHEHTVGKWRRRFLKGRCEGLLDEARPGRPRSIDDDQVAGVIERTLRTTPVDATHWSIRSMAAETGFSHTTIRRMWAAFGLQPHRSQTFKLSNDPLFVDKVRDIVGLYLSPPNRALVLSIDEKRISKAGAAFRSLGDPLWDTSSSQGRLLSTLLAAIADFERDLIRERTGDGRKRAMANGVKFGRKRKLSDYQRDEAIKRRDAGETLAAIAKGYGVSLAMISRL